MNPCLPDWSIGAELVPSQKKPIGLEHELVELVWQNGQVVLHSQNPRKPCYESSNSTLDYSPDQLTARSCGSPTVLVQNEETVSWIENPVDDSFERDFYSNFLCESPQLNPVEADKLFKQFDNGKLCKFGASEVNNLLPKSQNACFRPKPVPPPGLQYFDASQQQQQHPDLSNPVWPTSQQHPDLTIPVQPESEADLRSSNCQFKVKESSSFPEGDIRECSVMTVGSSHCGSNQVVNDAAMSRMSSSVIGDRGLSVAEIKGYKRKISTQRERGDAEISEPAITSSSDGSGSSFARTYNQSTGTCSLKRKSRDAEESECQSDGAELESAAKNKAAQKSGTTRRTRAAEVHNLSERRRRDRINEKMKALQELLPNSSKTDKASMLDEAIEYLKSLQLQIQMMWMGSGMPMMYPAFQHYMTRMGMRMGMGPPSLPSIHNAMQLPRLSLVDQTANIAAQVGIHQASMLNPVNFQSQLQNPSFAEQYAAYMGYHAMQNASQPINVFSYGANTMQQNQNLPPPGNNSGST